MWSPIRFLLPESAGSIPACPTTRPALAGKWFSFFPLFPPGGCRAYGVVAQRQSSGLQSRGHRFESCPSLQRCALAGAYLSFPRRGVMPHREQPLPAWQSQVALIRIRPGTVCPLSVRHRSSPLRGSTTAVLFLPTDLLISYTSINRKAPRKDGAAAGGIPLPRGLSSAFLFAAQIVK